MRYRLRLWDAKKSHINVTIDYPFINSGDVFELNGIRFEVLRRITVARQLPSDPNKSVVFDHNNEENYDELIVKELPENI